jgi:hypothetical protein
MTIYRLTRQEKQDIAEMVADMLEERFRIRQVLLTEEEAAKVCGLTKGSMRQMRYTGDGPAFIRMGEGPKAPIRYEREELMMWIATRPRYTATRSEYEREEARQAVAEGAR